MGTPVTNPFCNSFPWPCICEMWNNWNFMSPELYSQARPLMLSLETHLVNLHIKLKAITGKHAGSVYPQGEISFCEMLDQIDEMLQLLCHGNYNIAADDNSYLLSNMNAVNTVFEQLLELLPGDYCSSVQGSVSFETIQSPRIYVQAVGNDGTDPDDRSTNGIQVRWALLDGHFAKGENSGPFPTPPGYVATDDDYVALWKVEYQNRVPVTYDFSSPPVKISDNTEGKTWTIPVRTHNPLPGHPKDIENTLYVCFTDTAAYASIEASIDPTVNPSDFIMQYRSVLEVWVDQKTCFAMNALVQSDEGFSSLGTVALYETISSDGPYDSLKRHVSTRETERAQASPSGGPAVVTTIKVFSENIVKARIQCLQGFLQEISLEPYEDFIVTHKWELVDRFGLTIKDAEAMNRLDPASHPYAIDDNWPRYNDGITANKQNYIDKWSDLVQTDRLKDAVIQYLTLSQADAYAYAEFTDAGGEQKLRLSYQQMLNLAASDYHVARMLGLGYIDQNDRDANHIPQTYVYRVIYRHPSVISYMTLPTNRTNHRKPMAPQQVNVSYGLPMLNDCSEELVVDENGYAKFHDLRFVNVNRGPYPYELLDAVDQFYTYPDQYSLGKMTHPALFGVEYKVDGEPDYIADELPGNVDLIPVPNEVYSSYYDWDDKQSPATLSQHEIVLVPSKPNPLFTHPEREEGVHEYALYGVNWFSRVSELSDPVLTDDTEFNNDKVKPPVDVAVQYIQEEDPCIFTSAAEQSALAARKTATPAADNYQVRVTFNWCHLQKMSYQTANKLQFFFKQEAAIEVKGQVASVTEIDAEYVLVETEAYSILTKETIEQITPAVNTAAKNKLLGGLFQCKSGSFLIEDIDLAFNPPKFKLHKIKNIRNGTCTFVIPAAEEYFSANENLQNENNWVKLNQEIVLHNFSEYTEQETIRGVTSDFIQGGIAAGALIESVADLAGLYKISLSTSLSTYAGLYGTSNVDWYRGVLRVKDATGEVTKLLDVWRIDTLSPLVVYAYDADYGNLPVPLGTVNSVNFHPGYRVYLSAETAAGFKKENILPGTGQNSKQTMMALRAADDTAAPAKLSGLSVPAMLSAIRIKEPVAPGLPDGSLYATRPDFYGKSSYTLNVPVTTDPYSIAFYRADDNLILEALYDEETIYGAGGIKEQLNALPANYVNSILHELVNVIVDSSNTSATVVFKTWNGYALPEPDHATIFDGITGADNNAIRTNKIARIKEVVEHVFLPATEQPVICRQPFLKTGRYTENKKPKTRDGRGNLLDVADTSFDPFPFAKLYTNGSTVLRFTDYTLDGASRNLYFYFAREISQQLKMSERSTITGPIRLVNSSPAEAPVIRKTENVLASAFVPSYGIRFEINPYLASEGITKIALYRTFTEANAENVRRMQHVKDMDITEELVDYFEDFTGSSFPPVNEPVWYRLLALREIQNEDGVTEMVPSFPSDVLKAQLISNLNPAAPQIIPQVSSGSATALNGVVLKCNSVMYKGTYYLYQLTPGGNWTLLSTFGNTNNLSLIQFSLGNVAITDANNNLIYNIYKIKAGNLSGLFNLEDAEFNLTGYYVPVPALSGPGLVCIGQSKVYATPANSGSTFLWKVDNVNSGTGNQLTKSWSTAGNKTVELTETNTVTGIFRTVSMTVVVKPVPSPLITGTAPVCATTAHSYSTPNVAGNTYVWTVDGAQVNSGAGTNTVSLQWSSTGVKNISVTESNGACSTTATYTVTVYPLPNPSLTGTLTGCMGTDVIYTLHYNSLNSAAVNVTGGTVLNWPDVNSVTVRWTTAGTAVVQLVESNPGCSFSSQLSVNVRPLPSPAITGPASVTNGSTVPYNTPLVAGDIYNWEVLPPANGTITSGQGSAHVTIRWLRTGAVQLRLTETNACGPQITIFNLVVH